jgi:hypothetical protein
LQQRRIANAMPTNPAAMQPSQTGALEAADGVFSVAESSAGLGDRFKESIGELEIAVFRAVGALDSKSNIVRAAWGFCRRVSSYS